MQLFFSGLFHRWQVTDREFKAVFTLRHILKPVDLWLIGSPCYLRSLFAYGFFKNSVTWFDFAEGLLCCLCFSVLCFAFAFICVLCHDVQITLCWLRIWQIEIYCFEASSAFDGHGLVLVFPVKVTFVGKGGGEDSSVTAVSRLSFLTRQINFPLCLSRLCFLHDDGWCVSEQLLALVADASLLLPICHCNIHDQ